MSTSSKKLRQFTISLSRNSPVEKRNTRRSHVRETTVHDARLNEEGGAFKEPRTTGAARRSTEKKEQVKEEKPAYVLGKNSRGKMAVKQAGPSTPCRAGTSKLVKSPDTGASSGSDGGPNKPHRLGSPGTTPIVKEGRLARFVRREQEKNLAEAMKLECEVQHPEVVELD